MISPRSFLYSNRPRPSHHSPTSNPVSSSPSSTSSACVSSPSSPGISQLPSSSNRSRRTTLETNTTTTHPIKTKSATSAFTTTSRFAAPKYDKRRSDLAVTVTPVRSISPSSTSQFDDNMAKRKEKRETSSLTPSSPPSTTTGLTRPTTPTSPVQIPKHGNRETAHSQKRHSGHRRKPQLKDLHDPNSISPSLAALLAVTDIPRPRRQRKSRGDDTPSLTLEDVIDRQQVSEKDFSWSLSRGHMDLLLSPPEEMGDDDISICESNIGSVLSTRTVSADSVPSLGDSYMTDGISSLDTPHSSSLTGRRRSSNPRKSLEPVRSPPNATIAHPLQRPPTPDESDVMPLDVATLQQVADGQLERSQLLPFKPLKAVFKSNLTASLRALRSAAKSFSSINFSSIPPDYLTTRSLLTIDPNVPYTDERRPPVIEELPSAEMRRYLNPTVTSRLEPPSPAAPQPTKFSASIQMQTYKVHRSRSAPPTSRSSSQSTATTQSLPSTSHRPQSQSSNRTAFTYPLPMRQREMRENSDFIRIAVMEMMMRKNGKLDDQRPGRARWALPPRKSSPPTYEVGPNGVPARWTPINY